MLLLLLVGWSRVLILRKGMLIGRLLTRLTYRIVGWMVLGLLHMIVRRIASKRSACSWVPACATIRRWVRVLMGLIGGYCWT